MMIYQRMYSRLNMEKFYLSPYIDCRIEDSKIWFYNFETKKVIQLHCKDGEMLISNLINGLKYDELNQKLKILFKKKELTEKILILLIQNRIIE